MANKTKDQYMKAEVHHLTPEQAIAWCDALKLDWRSFDVAKVKGPITWVKALQMRANDFA